MCNNFKKSGHEPRLTIYYGSRYQCCVNAVEEGYFELRIPT